MWFIVGDHYVYLNKWPLTLLLWIAVWFAIGIIWWLVDIIRIPGLIRNANREIALEVMRTQKAISG